MGETAGSSAWGTVALGDVVRQVKDKVDPDASGLDRYVAGEHMDTDDLRIRRWGEIGNDYLGPAFHMRFKPGQVLYGSRRTYLRKVAIAEFEGITANTTFVLESKDPNVLMPELLPFLMQTERFNTHSVQESRGSVNPYVNFSDLAWYEFRLPPAEEQHRIVEILKESARLREKLMQASLAIRQVLESWMERALSLFDRPHLTLDAVVERATVGIVVKPADLYVPPPAGVPALRSLNVEPHRIVLDDCVHISQEGHASHSKSRLKPGDVVVVRSGRPGDAAVVPDDLGELNCIDLIVATPSEQLRPEFLCAFLNSRAGRRQFASGTAGTAQKHFNVGSFKKVVAPVPALDQQDAFVAGLSDLHRSRNLLDARLSSAHDLARRILREVLDEEDV